VVTPP